VFLGKGSAKTPHIFLGKKFHVENISKTIDNFFDVSFPRSFLFYRNFGCFSVMGVPGYKNTTILQNKSCRKVFTKKSTKNPKPICSRFCLSRFWAFVGGGSSKTQKKYREKKTDPGRFLASDPPTHHGGHRFVFSRPLALDV
jgi:hypothetical protein